MATTLPAASEALTPGVAETRSILHRRMVFYLILKAAISGVLIAAASQLAKRFPGFGALMASLPLVSILGALWLWKDRPDPNNMADHLQATFWYVLPSLPMFLWMPSLLRSGVPFWLTIGAGCALTVSLYLVMTWLAPKIGLRL